MKSKIISGPQLDKLVFKPEHLYLRVEKADLEQYAEAEFARVAKQYGEIIALSATDKIGAGDIVQVELTSTDAKFNKTVPLNVGKGFFNPEIEAALIGMTPNETKTIDVAATPVTMKVVSAKTKRIPDVTLQMLVDEYGECAQTVEEFWQVLMEERMEELKFDQYYTEAATYIGEEIIRQIEIEIDPAEYAQFKGKLMATLADEAKQEAISLETHLNNVFNEDGQAGPDELDDLIEKHVKRDFIFMVFAVQSLKDKIAPASLEEYDALIEEWAESGEQDQATLKAMMPYEEFVERSYVGEAQNLILDKFYQDLKVELV